MNFLAKVFIPALDGLYIRIVVTTFKWVHHHVAALWLLAMIVWHYHHMDGIFVLLCSNFVSILLIFLLAVHLLICKFIGNL